MGLRAIRKAITGLLIVGGTAAGVFFAANEKWDTAANARATDGALGQPEVVLGKSGLPIPRFVSLKSGRVNVRVGPGEDYKVSWVFTKPSLPVEVIQEFDTWRRIRDSDGQVGWVFHSLLSNKRTAVVTPWGADAPKALRATAANDAVVTAYLNAGVLATIDRCDGGWCRLTGNNFTGWLPQDQLWGVYQNEKVD